MFGIRHSSFKTTPYGVNVAWEGLQKQLGACGNGEYGITGINHGCSRPNKEGIFQ